MTSIEAQAEETLDKIAACIDAIVDVDATQEVIDENTIELYVILRGIARSARQEVFRLHELRLTLLATENALKLQEVEEKQLRIEALLQETAKIQDYYRSITIFVRSFRLKHREMKQLISDSTRILEEYNKEEARINLQLRTLHTTVRFAFNI